MKRIFSFFLILSIAVSLTGCDAVQRKFTRKRKEVKTPHFYQLKKYARKPSPFLYKQHFAYWASWQEELIQVIGENHKKDKQCVEEALGNLLDMQRILIPSKAEAMQPYVDKMEWAKNIIFRGDLDFANKYEVKRTVERVERGVKSDFCFGKVKDFIRKDEGDDARPK